MTMKKRFLGLALATAVALPATSAYAATNSQTITGNENEIKRHEVTVTGIVNNKDGEVPTGMISVELPTKMAFTVDQSGRLTGSTYSVVNKGKVGVDISVADFTESKNGSGIDVLPESDLATPADKYRNQVSLILSSKENTVDLGEFDPTAASGNKLLSLAGGNTGSIVLNGTAGTKASTGDGVSAEQQKVDNEGVTEDFTLVFKINKTK